MAETAQNHPTGRIVFLLYDRPPRDRAGQRQADRVRAQAKALSRMVQAEVNSA